MKYNMNPKQENRHHNLKTLQQEYLILKSKHDSKIEAILILSKELENYRNERDQFKLMAEKLQEKYSALKKRVEGWGPSLIDGYNSSYTENQGSQELVQLLCESKEQNKSLNSEVQSLRQKLTDSDGDIKLLREQIARQRVGNFDEGISNRSYPAHERETLVKDLEDARVKCSMLEKDLQAIIDEKEELVTIRDEYKKKIDRLNQHINVVLKGDEKKLIDIDSILMENRYLQERLKQTQEEKSMVATTLSKYKSMLEKKKTRLSISKPLDPRGTAVITHKQVEELLREDFQMKYSDTSSNIADLRNLLVALYEALNDKKLALSHQKKANKILGTRITELEDKIKSLSLNTSSFSSNHHNSDLMIDKNPDSRTTSPNHSLTDEVCRSPKSTKGSFSSNKSIDSPRSSFAGNKSRSCSVSSDQETEDNKFVDVFIDESDRSPEHCSLLNSEICERSSTTDEPKDDLPPSLQKLVNAALEDMSNVSSSNSAVIESSHSEMKIVKLNRSSSSESRVSLSPETKTFSMI